MNEAKISLGYPVQLADRQLTEVTMRRPTMGDMLDNPMASERDLAGEVKLIARLCALTTEDVRLMDAADYLRLQQQFVSFRIGTEK